MTEEPLLVSQSPSADGETPGASYKPPALPRISIDAFCEDRETAEMLQATAADRRLARVDMNVCIGGVEVAIPHCVAGPAPNLVVVETTQSRAEMLDALDRLTRHCGPATSVMVIGRVNDVVLYRQLLRRGISEYLLAPVSPAHFIESVAGLFANSGTGGMGRIIAFTGAKGGVGSSTVCHNVAWAMSEALQSDVVIADLDLAFGTAGLDFNQDPLRGMAEALQASERLDETLLEQCLTRCSEHLSILGAPLTLDREHEISGEACDAVLDTLRQYVPFVAVDLPHAWTAPVRRVLLQADEIVLTAAPDLANLRNAKALADSLRASRRNGRRPHLVVNMAKVPRRPDLSVKEFTAAVDLDPAQVIEFDSETFGFAANNGQMIEEFSAKARAARQFRSLAFTLADRAQPKEDRRPSPLAPILERFGLSLLARGLRPFSTA